MKEKKELKNNPPKLVTDSLRKYLGVSELIAESTKASMPNLSKFMVANNAVREMINSINVPIAEAARIAKPDFLSCTVPTSAVREMINSINAPIAEAARIAKPDFSSYMVPTSAIRAMIKNINDSNGHSSSFASSFASAAIGVNLDAKGHEAAKAIMESMNSLTLSISKEQLKSLQRVDYGALFSKAISDDMTLESIVEEASSVVEDNLEADPENKDSFSTLELQEAMNEQVTNPKRFQERVYEWSERKKAQYCIVFWIIIFIYSNFLQPYIQENIGKPVTTYVVSNVKEFPEKGAKIIGKISENIDAIITENTNYYYKVSYIDENGEKKEGYVAKRNLKIIEENTENIEEETEVDIEEDQEVTE